MRRFEGAWRQIGENMASNRNRNHVIRDITEIQPFTRLSANSQIFSHKFSPTTGKMKSLRLINAQTC